MTHRSPDVVITEFLEARPSLALVVGLLFNAFLISLAVWTLVNGILALRGGDTLSVE